MWDKIMRRLKLIASVGNVISSNQTTQTVDFADGEVPENIKFAQGYGIEVYPLPGSKAFTIFNAGDRSQGITVLTVDCRYTCTHELAPGDVMVLLVVRLLPLVQIMLLLIIYKLSTRH